MELEPGPEGFGQVGSKRKDIKKACVGKKCGMGWGGGMSPADDPAGKW